MEEEIINRVAASPLVTIDLENYYHQGERVIYDLAQNLFQGVVLREKDLREFVKEHDWSQYEGKNVALICSEDAIVPTWAYMLITTKLEGVANMVVLGNTDILEFALYREALSKISPEDYTDKPVVIKGCGKLPVPESAYVELTRLLKPYVKSIMYGEPCSTVPLYKKPKSAKS